MNCIDHNGDIAGYSVRYVAQGSGNTQTLSVSEGDTTEATIFGLMHDTQYTIEVRTVISQCIVIRHTCTMPCFKHEYNMCILWPDLSKPSILIAFRNVMYMLRPDCKPGPLESRPPAL